MGGLSRSFGACLCRFDDAETREPLEPSVEGHERGVVLDCEGGQVGVADVRAGNPRLEADSFEESPVPWSFVESDRCRRSKKLSHSPERQLRRVRPAENPRIGRNADERAQNRPWNPDKLMTIAGVSQPGPRDPVVCEVIELGGQKDVDVRDEQMAPRPRRSVWKCFQN